MRKKTASRRMFLRGAAATVALPFLHSAMPRDAWSADIETPRRLVYWFFPNGVLPEYLVPATVGTDWSLTRSLASYEDIRDRVSVLSKVTNLAAIQSGYVNHDTATATVLTDSPVEAYSGTLDAGISADQRAALHFTGVTPFPSLQLGTNASMIPAFGNTATYYGHISWGNGSVPLPNLPSPRGLFDRLFAGSDPALTEAELEHRKRARASVLDKVLERSNTLSKRLSRADQLKLDQYLTGVRELETRLDLLDDASCETPEAPPTGLRFEESVALMTELTRVALECDLTRVVTFMMGPSTSLQVLDFLNIASDHHTLSHALSGPSFDNFLRCQDWQYEQFGQLIRGLAATSDAPGQDLLSSTLAIALSDFDDGYAHTADELPIVVAGGEGGGLSQGVHHNMGGDHLGNLHLMALQYLGLDIDAFGLNGREPMEL